MRVRSAGKAVLLALAPACAQENLISQIGWKSADWGIIILLLVIMLGGLGVLVFFHLRSKYKEAADQREFDDNVFVESAERVGLTEREISELRSLLRHEPSSSPQAVFQSVSFFERCLHAEVQELQHTRMPAEERDMLATVLRNIRTKLGFNVLPFEHPLVSTRNISVGQVLSVFGQSRKSPLIQRAAVVDNTPFLLRIQYNVQQEDAVKFSLGDPVKLVFARQNDGFYGIPIQVAGFDNAGTVSFYHTLDLKRNQLRQYVRIEVNIPLKFRLITTSDPDKSEVKRGQMVEGRVADISGGGMSFLSSVALKPGDTVSLNFRLPQTAFGGTVGRILRVSLQEGRTQTQFRHHVEFQNLPQGKRERIVKYVFERQRQINQWR